MTCEELLDWVEDHMDKPDFRSYDDLEDFEKDLLNAPFTVKTDGRSKGAQDRLDEWMKGDLDVKGYDIEDIKGTIIDNATEDVREKVTEAETEEDLDKIDISDITGDAKEQAEGLVDSRRGEIIVEETKKEMEGVEKEFMEAIAAGTPEEGIDKPYTMGEIKRRFGKEFHSKISMAMAERGEELFDIAQAKKTEK